MTLMPFSPPPGLNSDDTTFSAEGRWADGNNVRFRLGKPQTIGVYGKHPDAVQMSGIPRAIHPHRFIIGTSTKLYRFTVEDVTPAGFASTVAHWAFASWGDYVLAVPSAGTLYEYTGSGDFTEITNAPNAITWMVVTPQRQVMALGCNEEGSGTFNGRCIRWCDLEDNTDWTTTATNNAGEHILEGAGTIITGREIGIGTAIFTTDALYLATFVGDPSQTYHFDKIADVPGPIGPQAVTAVNGALYWFSSDRRLRTWAPGAVPATIPCPILRNLISNLPRGGGAEERIIVGTNSRYNELWIFYTDTNDLTSFENSRYIAVNLEEGSWFQGQLARTAWCDSPLIQAEQASSGLRDASIFACDSSGWLYVHDIDPVEAPATVESLTWHIQSADFYLDESQRRAMVRKFIPDFEYQTGNVSLTLFMRDRPQSSATTKGPYTLGTSDTKEDFRASGKIMAVKLSGTGTTTKMRLGKPLFDVVPLGER